MNEKKENLSPQPEKRIKKEKQIKKLENNCENLSFAAREAFKRLRTNLVMSFAEDDGQSRIVGVTSAQPSEGKSTVSLNLAYSLAELGKNVLLVDADMRRPTIHSKAGISVAPGLSNLMGDINDISLAVKRYTNTSGTVSFDIIPGGNIPNNPAELLNSKRMGRLLRALSTAYDYVLLDLPPVGAVIDAVSVSKCTDGMLIVIRENDCPRSVLADCVDQLKFAGVNILGFVVNGALEGAGKKYQYSNYY